MPSPTRLWVGLSLLSAIDILPSVDAWSFHGSRSRSHSSPRLASLTVKRALPVLPAGWSSVSQCLTDANQRALPFQLASSPSMTLDQCINLANSAGYMYAGAEYMQECWAGNSIVTSGGAGAVSTNCNTPCGGNSAQICGGSWALTVYSKTGSTSSSSVSSSSSTSSTTTTMTSTSVSIASASATPMGWTGPQCIRDANTRALTNRLDSSSNQPSMTIELCQSLCVAAGYNYCGIEYGGECYGDTSLHMDAASGSGSTIASSSCTSTCNGNVNEICGGGWALSLYTKGASGTTPGWPTGWSTQFKCVTDYAQRRRYLPYFASTSNSMTSEYCIGLCDAAGYKFAGTENANECHCGSTPDPFNGGDPAVCDMVCTGNSAETCGGRDALTLFNKNFAGYPYVTNLPPNWVNSSQCITDNSARVLTGAALVLNGMSLDACVEYCDQLNYSYAGAEYGDECYCGNSIVTSGGAGTVAASTDCNMPCAGNAAQNCGGSGRMTTYHKTVPSLNLPSGWSSSFCSYDSPKGSVMNGYHTTIASMTPSACVTTCNGKNYAFAGVEGTDCYCGAYLVISQPDVPSACNSTCAGSSALTCGGTNRMQIYAKAAPAVASNLQWSLSQAGNSGVVMSGIAVMNSETVLVHDRKENNPLLDSQGDPAWAAVWSLTTNTPRALDLISHSFCSTGNFLSNGTFINFGGHPYTDRDGQATLDGTQSVRFFNPCAASDNCQIWEDYERVRMAVRRWYPSSTRIYDGSVLLFGGATTSTGWDNNADYAQNDYEFFPAKNINGYNGLPIPSQFLTDTLPFNMYPYVFALPDKRIFVAANNMAMFLNWETNTETRLPNLPNGQRVAYPFGALGVMLPLTPANNYTPEILICGGSHLPNDVDPATLSAQTSPTSTQCSRMVLSSTGVMTGWAVESMPDQRVLVEGVILPTGKILIVNGAKTGTAAYNTLMWETGNSNADNPSSTPLLYDPAAPVGSRFSYSGMPTSQIPRMYHSTATLLPSGAIMLGGSNPNDDFSTARYPSELRVEYLNPSYMSATRPTFSGLPTNINYGATFPLQVTLPTGTKNVVVVLMDLGFATHTVHMDQKFVQLVSTQNGNTLTVTGPPSAPVFSPGPGWIWVVADGIPSIGQKTMIGTGANPPSDAGATANMLANTAAPSGNP